MQCFQIDLLELLEGRPRPLTVSKNGSEGYVEYFLILEESFSLNWVPEISRAAQKKLDEDFKSSMSFLPSFEDVTGPSHARDCLIIYFGCLKSLFPLR